MAKTKRKVIAESRMGYPYCSEHKVCSGEARRIVSGTPATLLERDRKTGRILILAGQLYAWVDDSMLCDEEEWDAACNA